MSDGQARPRPAATAGTVRGRPPAVNDHALVAVSVLGQIAHPVARATAHRIGHDGVPRVLPGTGGIVLNRRIGDAAVGLAGDHVEPGVALHNNGREVVGPRNGPNLALVTYACVGNVAEVVSGRMAGRRGLVTGKHGGIDHVLVDFPSEVLARLVIGDRVQVRSHGMGLATPAHPQLTWMNCSPALVRRWGLVSRPDGVLEVPVTHRIPARAMGSGLGRNTAWRGDIDIQLADAATRARHRLGSLRFGDFVAIADHDADFGPSMRRGRVTVGVVVHGDSTVSGHGPGVTPLLSGPAGGIALRHEPRANLAEVFGVRAAVPARERPTWIEQDPRRRGPVTTTTGPARAHRHAPR